MWLVANTVIVAGGSKDNDCRLRTLNASLLILHVLILPVSFHPAHSSVNLTGTNNSTLTHILSLTRHEYNKRKVDSHQESLLKHTLYILTKFIALIYST